MENWTGHRTLDVKNRRNTLYAYLLAFFIRRLIKCCNGIENAFTLVLNIQNGIFSTWIITVTVASASALACNTTECKAGASDNDDVGTICTCKTGQTIGFVWWILAFQDWWYDVTCPSCQWRWTSEINIIREQSGRYVENERSILLRVWTIHFCTAFFTWIRYRNQSAWTNCFWMHKMLYYHPKENLPLLYHYIFEYL